MSSKACFWSILVLALAGTDLRGQGFPIEYFPEPHGLRIVNQTETEGVILADHFNVTVTQVFTIDTPGYISAIGCALASAGRTPSLTTSLHRVVNGVVEPASFATTTLPGEYFASIGPQDTPVWAYAEFSEAAVVAAGEQVAFRIESPSVELWGPRRDVLPNADIVEIPGTDLTFRAYLVPEPEIGLLLTIGCSVLSVVRMRASDR